MFDYHRELCAACVAHKRDHGHYSCKAVAAAWEVVWEFREQRIRVSKAQWLRAINDAGLPT